MDVLSILTGVFSAAIFAVCAYFFKVLVFPYLKTLFFDVPNIAGEWQTFDALDKEPVGKAVIRQRLREVDIVLSRHTDREGKNTDMCFRARGKFASGQLVLIFEHEHMKGYIMGACVMLLLPNGVCEGKTLYVDRRATGVVARDFFMKRKMQ